MAQFFQGRDPIGSVFYLNTDPKERIECTAFKRWIDTNQGITLHCGRDANIEISKAIGLDEKKSETSEDSIESTLGVTGVAQLKSKMKEILGHEIHWNRATTTKASLSRKAPPCGRYELAVHQLIREYDFAFFRRGSWPFHRDTWDLKEQRTVPEYTETYDLIEDDFEFDERCKKNACGAPATAPDYEGRVSLDCGNVTLNAPFKISASGFIIIRLGREEIPIEGLTPRDVERQSQLTVPIPVEWLPEIARFLGDFSTETVTGSISFDPRFKPAARDAKGLWMQSVLAADTLTGDRVVNRQKEDLGTIEHLMIDLQNGRVAYAVLSFGGFLGMGDKLFAIPWSALKVDTTERQFILEVDKKLLQRAPGFDKAHWPNMADRIWGAEVSTYYGAKPYWT